MPKMDTKFKMNDSLLGLAQWSPTFLSMSDMYVYHLLYKLVNPVFDADSFCGFSSMFKPNRQDTNVLIAEGGVVNLFTICVIICKPGGGWCMLVWDVGCWCVLTLQLNPYYLPLAGTISFK